MPQMPSITMRATPIAADPAGWPAQLRTARPANSARVSWQQARRKAGLFRCLSVQRPLQIRKAMEASCTTDMTAAAAPSPNWAWSCRNTVPKDSTANCGAHRMPMPAAMRQACRSLNGLGVGVAARSGAAALPRSGDCGGS